MLCTVQMIGGVTSRIPKFDARFSWTTKSNLRPPYCWGKNPR